MDADMGRKVAIIDDMGVWPELAEYRVSPAVSRSFAEPELRQQVIPNRKIILA